MLAQHELSGKCVLVVEDEYNIAVQLASHLSENGIVVAGPTGNVDDALNLIGSTPGLAGAILDVRLGEDNVFPVADELERLGIPFVFATAYEPDQVPARHADKILVRKPVEDSAIVATLTEAVDDISLSVDQACKNGLLARLPRESLELALPRLRRVMLPKGAILERPNQIIRRVYFPIDCVGSMIVVGREGNRIETGLIGREGMTGASLIDGDDRTPYELITQIDGEALTMTSEDFAVAAATAPGLAALAARFARSLGVQVSYTALSNGRFDLGQRLARWLVMVHDRVPGRAFQLTHDYLAIMLGVRRSTVTDAIHILEGEKLIRSTRNHLEIRDRDGLVAKAGEGYGAPEAEYDRLMVLPSNPASGSYRSGTVFTDPVNSRIGSSGH